MAWTLPTGSRSISLNGVTAVQIVAAPAGSLNRMVTQARVENLDSIPHIIAIQLDVSGSKSDLKRKTVPAGGQLEMETPYDLIGSTQSLYAVLGEAASGTQPKAHVAFAEQS